MKNILLLLMIALLLGACNLRENTLLPPNLNPADYQTGNIISVYSDYLIKSSNDDSYFLLKKEAISDSLLFWGDEISFQKVQDLTARDSLYFQTGTIDVSYTYKLAVKRDSIYVDLLSTIPMGYVYTDLQDNYTETNTVLVYDSYYLSGTKVPIDNYSTERISFPVYQNGEFSLLQINHSNDLTIISTVASKALLLTSDEEYSFRLPQSYTQSAGETTLSLSPNLEVNDVTTVQSLFPGFSLNSQVLDVHTANITSEIGIVRIQRASKTLFGKQWVKLSNTQISTWSEFDTSTEIEQANWSTDSGSTYSFIKYSGKYFFVTPIDTQNSLTIPFNGNYDQCFIQNVWFDLRGIIDPNLSMKIELNPDTNSLINSYFSGTPFRIVGQHLDVNISFWQSGVLIVALPDEQWIEFGIQTAFTSHTSNRLFRYYGTAGSDLITYKGFSNNYSADSFTATGKYIYNSLANSGTYLYGNISENGTSLNVPYLKNSTFFQTSSVNFGWNSSKKRSFSSLNIDLDPVTADTHPWIAGQPFTVSNKVVYAKARFAVGTTYVDEVPTEFFMGFQLPTAPSKMIALSATADYPKLKEYLAGTSYLENTFVYSDGVLNIYPSFGGTFFSANLTTGTLNNYSLFLNPRMKFELDAFRVLMDVSTPIVGSALLNITKKASMTDPTAILSSQYDLSATSDVYEFRALNPILYSSHQPMILLKKNTRRSVILFSVISGGSYRIYTYPSGDTADGWHFTNSGNYNAFYLVSDGEYRTYTDNQPHTTTSTFIKSAQQDYILSLYQAQLTVPQFYIGTTLPLGSRIELAKELTLPGLANPLGAYKVSFFNSQNIQIQANFFNVPGATNAPYVYVPVTDINALPTMRMFYRNLAGVTTPLTRVDQFSDNAGSEFIVIGNCAIGLINNPGWYYVTN
ncbi:MAG: hypothetical protein CVU48_08330 [Candidatus Cloacimonetes bacterium HGW-Cloacimonetes-1]|jgi:hypothetical protein|nr:MAG: hypothetical protein CVU48_08330 [Candidatus Cloacimonetes bacterium HGW-Cloacimonetes-1]